MRAIRPVSLLMLSLLALAGCNKPAEQAAAPAAASGEQVIKLGHASPMTGPIAHIGKDTEYGAQIAVDELNGEGFTLGGKPVKFQLVSEDDQGDPKMATQIAQRMVDAKIAGMIGHLNSGTTIPASKIYADANIGQITPSATNPAFTQQGFKTTFRLIADDVQQGKALADFAVNTLKAKKIAIIDDRSAYGQGLADEFDKAAKALGVEIVKREFTSTSATDFMAILTGIKGAQPDLIFFGGVDAQAAPMVKQMQKLGVKAPLLSGDGTQTGNFIKLAAEAAEGQYASAAGAPKEQLPGYASFAEKLKNKYNAEVVIYSPYSYDAVKVMAMAMKAADSADPKQYLPKLAATNYQGATGHITFDAQGNRQRSAVTIYQVKQGKWEVIGVVGGENTAQADAPTAGKAAGAQ